MTTARVSAERFVPMGGTKTDYNIAERVVMMCASALFAGLSESECLEIATCAHAKTYARDELLFMQGQPVRSLMLIQSGSVKLTQISSSGNEAILWMNGSGDPVGFHADAMGCSHTCSARAMENCKAAVWEYNRLQQLLTQYPQIRKNIVQILSGRLNELQERFREMATEKVGRRLALTLIRLMKQVGKPAHGGVQINLSREELAQMTGTTLFTISRLLSQWSEEGLVIPRREAVVVLDARRLERLSASAE